MAVRDSTSSFLGWNVVTFPSSSMSYAETIMLAPAGIEDICMATFSGYHSSSSSRKAIHFLVQWVAAMFLSLPARTSLITTYLTLARPAAQSETSFTRREMSAFRPESATITSAGRSVCFTTLSRAL